MAETVGPKPLDNFRMFIRKLNRTPLPVPLPFIQKLDEQPSGEEIMFPIEEATFRFNDTNLVGATPAELNHVEDVTINDGYTLGSAMITDQRIPYLRLETAQDAALGRNLEERVREIIRETMEEMRRTPGMVSRDIWSGRLIGKEEEDPRKKKEDVRKIIL